MTDEIWKPIKDFEDSYEVSSKGRVRSLDKIVVDNLKGTERRRLIKGKILKPYLCKGNGYLLVTLSKNSKFKYKTIHRLVAESFIPNPNSYPSINHKDEDKQNNNLENLEWCTVSYNTTYGTAQERHSKNSINKGRSRSVVQLSLNDELISIYPSFAEVKRKLGYDASYIRRKCYFKYGNNIAFGFKWLTYEEYKRRNTECH